MDTALQPTRSFQARQLALREVHGQPGILQGELAERLHGATGLAPSTSVKLLRTLEREGRLEGRRVGRRKAYRLCVPRGRAWEPAAVLAALLALAMIAAIFLTPARHSFYGVSTDPAQVQAGTPANGAGADLRRARLAPSAVLSAVDVPHIAAHTGTRLRRSGFHVRTIANAAGPRARSVVLHGAGQSGPAAALAHSLGIRSTATLDRATRTVAPSASLAVVLGADRR